MIYNWKLKEIPDPEMCVELQNSLGVSSIISKLLVQRRIDTFDQAKTYFRPSLNDLHDPFLMKDMDKAVSRLCNAIKNKESICVYGDYDVDGTTSVAMMTHFLENEMEANVSFYIPDRYGEGYGVSASFIESIPQKKYDLIITLDCGIRAVELIEKGNSYGADFIICDHHNPGEVLPPAKAVLDQKRKDCSYPYKGLSGCGVGFKLIQGVLDSLEQDESIAYQYLDLLTISIGADIVPMNGENRIMSFYGLKEINANPRVGIQAMVALSGSSGKVLTNGDVVFMIAPRINAAGRISHAEQAVELLLAATVEDASEICQKIEGFNKERRTVDKDITQQALSVIDQDSFYLDSLSTVVWGKDWHKGVIGIVASRLIENYYKPTVVLTELDGVATGSARSIKGLDIHSALKESEDLLIKYGGHTMAAGMSIKSENLPEFRKKFDETIKSRLGTKLLEPEIIADLEIELAEIDFSMYKILAQFAPFGPSNMTPLFVTRNVVDAGYSKLVGETKEHLKLTLVQKNSSSGFFSGIAFKQAKFHESLKNGLQHDIIYSVEINEWQGKKTLQLNIRDIKLSENSNP